MQRWVGLAAAGWLLGSCPLAAAPAAGAAGPDALSRLKACRGITDIVQRANCYDRETDALDSAIQRRDVVVLDRARVQETRKTLFGLSLPRLAVLDGGDQEELNEITGKVASASTDRDGRILLQLTDGARWRQTDDLVPGRFPKPGADVVIRRGALGSFRISVGGLPAFKAKREN